MNNYKPLGENVYMLEQEMTNKEKEKKMALQKNVEFGKQIHFWGKKYHKTSGAEHMKCLVSEI